MQPQPLRKKSHDRKRERDEETGEPAAKRARVEA